MAWSASHHGAQVGFAIGFRVSETSPPFGPPRYAGMVPSPGLHTSHWALAITLREACNTL